LSFNFTKLGEGLSLAETSTRVFFSVMNYGVNNEIIWTFQRFLFGLTIHYLSL